MSFIHLKVISRILYWILNSTGSQCSCVSTSLMCSCSLLVFNKNRFHVAVRLFSNAPYINVLPQRVEGGHTQGLLTFLKLQMSIIPTQRLNSRDKYPLPWEVISSEVILTSILQSTKIVFKIPYNK